MGKAGRHSPVPFVTQLAHWLSAESWCLLLILVAVRTYKARSLDQSCAPGLDFGPLHVPGWLTRGPGGSDAGVPNLPAKSGMGIRLRCGLLAVCNKGFIGMTMQRLLGLKAWNVLLRRALLSRPQIVYLAMPAICACSCSTTSAMSVA